MMAKLKHPQPVQYKIEYVLHNSMLASTNYYQVFHSSEALVDLLYHLNKKNIKGKDINVLSIEEFCPYSEKWIDRTEKAIENTESEKLILSNSSILFNNNAVTETA